MVEEKLCTNKNKKSKIFEVYVFLITYHTNSIYIKCEQKKIQTING